MRRLFIIRKDLNLTGGKLAAMIGHCAEAYWLNLIKSNKECPPDIMSGYIMDIMTKTICEAKNLNQLQKAADKAKELGLIENVDFGFIDDCCKTELTPEFTDENGVGRCRVGIWFKPLSDDISHEISKKYQLYKG